MKPLIIFLLISFITSFQDDNCLITFEHCDYEDENTNTITIQHCKYNSFSYDGNGEKEEYCTECETNYVVSSDRKTCNVLKNKIDNCISYISDSEDEYCDRCDNAYILSDDKKRCVKLENPISNCKLHYNYGDDLICSICQEGYFRAYDGKRCFKIDNCVNIDYTEFNNCEECKDGYALSYDQKSCISFENCKQLAQGNEKCSDCHEYYHPDSEGKCIRTLCEEYDNNVCKSCYDGYYLNEQNECQKITNIPYCLQLDQTKKICTKCIANVPTDNDGKCKFPTNLIKGCNEYDGNGKCIDLDDEYELIDNGKTGKFKGCPKGTLFQYCGICKAGYIFDKDDSRDGKCIGYDGSKDTSSSMINKVEYALLLFGLALLL